jgi:hypothetical protein
MRSLRQSGRPSGSETAPQQFVPRCTAASRRIGSSSVHNIRCPASPRSSAHRSIELPSPMALRCARHAQIGGGVRQSREAATSRRDDCNRDPLGRRLRRPYRRLRRGRQRLRGVPDRDLFDRGHNRLWGEVVRHVAEAGRTVSWTSDAGPASAEILRERSQWRSAAFAGPGPRRLLPDRGGGILKPHRAMTSRAEL